MSLAHVEDRGDRVVVVNTNTARRNALSEEYYQAVLDGLKLAEEPRITSVTLWAEGFFCAGGDLSIMAKRTDLTEAERRDKIDGLHNVVRAIRACQKPVIAAVEGGAAGAGASIALACDFIIAAEGANFTAAYVKAGLVPDGGLSASLAGLVPRALASQMLILGEPIAAERLANAGAINAVAEAGTTLAKAMELADRVAQGPTLAQGRIKAMLTAAHDNTFNQQLDVERDAMAAAIAAPEAAEGISAFLEKRPPDFAKLREK